MIKHIALLLTLLLVFPVFAQLTPTALTGVVTAGDTPAINATITATSRATQATRTTTADASGRYWIGAMTPGMYDITFSRAGLTSLSRPAMIELGRITRADARLEPSEDEETITSTATTVSVAETTAITTHFWSDELERVPQRRDVLTAASLSPTPFAGATLIDDATLFLPTLLGEEALDEVTIVRGAMPVELDGAGGSVILARTRSGTDAFALSLRDTYATNDGGGHTIESTSAGRIVPDRLWFFAAGWGGEPRDTGLRKLRGLALKATANVNASHQLIASHIGAGGSTRAIDLDTSTTALRYTGVFNDRLTGEAIVSRAEASAGPPPHPALSPVTGGEGGVRGERDDIAAKLAYHFGDHVITAGGDDRETSALYVSDRWSAGRWVVDAGVRHDDAGTRPRVAALFDLQSERGSHALVASWGEYTENARTLRVATFGYTSSLESSGAARIDVFHFTGARDFDQIQADARYRLFDRFEAGGSYTYSRGDDAPLEHLATARIGVQIPFAGHELAAMFLERYDSQTWTTSFGVRYDFPVRRIGLTVAADATNLFDTEPAIFEETERAFRFWVRARL